MASHPQEQQAIAEELDHVLAGRAPTATDLPQLPRLSRSIKETLRLYPPGAALLTRIASTPVRVAGFEIPPGAMIRLTPALTQRDPRWFQEPEAFRPERFDPGSGHGEIPRGAYPALRRRPARLPGQPFRHDRNDGDRRLDPAAPPPMPGARAASTHAALGHHLAAQPAAAIAAGASSLNTQPANHRG